MFLSCMAFRDWKQHEGLRKHDMQEKLREKGLLTG